MNLMPDAFYNELGGDYAKTMPQVEETVPHFLQ